MAETLADKIRRLQAEMAARAATQKQRAYQSGTAKTARDIASATWFFASLSMGLHWAWVHFVWPVWRQVRRPLWWIAGRYVALWNWFVIVRDPYGKPTFSKTRAGVMVIATIGFWIFLLDPCLELVANSALYALTSHVDEEVILLSSQEVDTNHNTHNIEGCWKFPCSDSDSLYFRVKGGLFNNVWNIVHGKGMFYPDYVAAAIPTVPSRCIITSYGFRANLILRSLNAFPEVLEVKSCDVIPSSGK
jgi:hypothetical protein